MIPLSPPASLAKAFGSNLAKEDREGGCELLPCVY
jgi:hypothetical protein